MADRSEAPGPDPESIALLDLITGFWKPQVIFTALNLGLPDLMAGETKSSDELAAAIKAHRPSVYRLLRAMCAIGLCAEVSRGVFELTAQGNLLHSGSTNSLHHAALFFGTQILDSWRRLPECVKTGKSAFQLGSGAGAFDRLAQDSHAVEVFHQAMLELTRMSATPVAASYDFSGMNEIVDVGGGHGELLCAILRRNPTIRGVIFDLPHAQAHAESTIAEAGLSERCRFASGSFFDSVPAGADAYLLKSVIHDWDDETATRILGNCKSAMKQTARVLLIEQLMPQRVEPAPPHQTAVMLDLTMMVAPGGRERTHTELTGLLRGAGLKEQRIIATPTPFNILEAVAA